MTIIHPPGVKWMVILLIVNLGYVFDIFTPRVQSQEQICSSWEFHVDDRSESSSTYDMIIGNVPRSPWRIMHNHKLQ
jgi:hypothetical protein